MKESKTTGTCIDTKLRSTTFHDGMIVTADDLTTAMMYPVSLLQPLIRAYFCCGVVCGFKVDVFVDPCTQSPQIKIHPGVALDGCGYPLELCKEVIINLTDHICACDCDSTRKDLCIAIRRGTKPESSSDHTHSCECGQSTCTKSRAQKDCLYIKVFTEKDKPKEICELTDKDLIVEDTCNCLKECSPCCCCGESWVLLGCLRPTDRQDLPYTFDESHRRYVKPIHCHCQGKPKIDSPLPPEPVEPLRRAVNRPRSGPQG